ncbi:MULTISPECIES: dihydroxyacetone kinase subunit DhaK [Bacillus cereus group]|uniref:Dihydroxyacetone kinase subunit DhaK n=2 Tax=Bacillus cereus group TaxID=86661 RepID=A0A9X5C4F0_BACCE|nr:MULTISPECIES: dihydroxyacetone kinase subunit DhaK [Bacillus cereus group]HDR5352367.1 dihydroxyacetone kinase subunit DhaK [Bacillus thuringiensis]MCJ0850248.1 dihydroxyacetone kinase subunit DhaK [Bacillus cereus]MDA2051298.1 dihydroxyacetone kinase subunit DhaK [Bacillus cereus]MDA4080936.1 dihydroxyacetone kinase subunit DhaK [Bacillus cereus]MDN4877077.1 dihydroxyacetone kinase subunit DhaK [Bacillus cereus]
MKKIINNPEKVVRDMIDGMLFAHSDKLQNMAETNIIIRANSPFQGKVAIVSGGGSGHEPAHIGFVGKGMLDAAVMGEIFTSPTPDQILKAIQKVHTGSGVLLIVKNYSGDIMNFEMAAEMAEAQGIPIATVIVNDDIAINNSSHTMRRRGISGTIFVHKIAGAMAEKGASLKEVEDVANKVIANIRSMGMALTTCTIPGSDTVGYKIGENEVEVGIGIHGEPGTHRISMIAANEMAELLLEHILSDMQLKIGDKVAVMVNGLGGTPLMELYILNKMINTILNKIGIDICKTYVGEYMTAIDMAGFSITLLKLDEQLTALLNDPANTTNWRVQ